MNLRSFLSILAAGAIALLVLGVVGFSKLTAQSPVSLLRGGKLLNPSGVVFVPKQAPVMASLLVNPDRLEAFRQWATTPGNRRRSRQELTQIKQNLLANTGLDYARDLKPWLGEEITLVVTSLDFDRDRQNGPQPGYLLIATTKNAARSREFLQQFWQKQTNQSTDLAYEQFKGVNLIYNNQPLKAKSTQSGGYYTRKKTKPQLPKLATAVVGDRFVLFANSVKVLRDAINNVQAIDLGLSNTPSYQQSLERLTAPRIGLTYFNLPELSAWIAKKPAPETDQPNKILTVGLSVNRQGLEAENALLISAEDSEPSLKEPVEALQYVPSESALAAAGTDLNAFWTQLQGSTEDSQVAVFGQWVAQAVDQLQSQWGMNLPDDIFSWVRGEYAIALLPIADREPDWVFVAEKTNESTAAIAHLDTVAKEKGFSVGNLTLGGQQITVWTNLVATANKRLETEVKGVHGTVGNYEIFTRSVEAMDEALQGRDRSLLKNDKFKEAIATLPQPNNGYLYADWKPFQPIIEQQFPLIRVAEVAMKPFFESLRSLTFSSYGSQTGIQRSQVFFQLGQS